MVLKKVAVYILYLSVNRSQVQCKVLTAERAQRRVRVLAGRDVEATL